jgi:hypothetical protein
LKLPFVSLIAGSIVITGAMQGAGFALRRQKEKAAAMKSVR